MANPISFLTGAATKLKSLGGKALDVAGRGALYSQAFNTSSNQMTMGQRIGGAVSQGILDNTLGQMGTLGSAVRSGLQSRGSKQAPTGGTGDGSSSVPFTPIKTDSVVQAINQSTQQILGGLNTLNATFRLGLNATANQMQAQASGVTKLKDDTQDMLLVLNDIYDLLNKQDYESNRSNIAQGSSGVMPVTSDGVTKQPEGSLLQDFLTGALISLGPSLISRMMPILGASIIPAIGGAITHFFDTDTTKAGNSIVGSWINENIPGAAAVDDFMFRMSSGFMGTDINDPRYSWNQNKESKPQPVNPNKSRAEAITSPILQPKKQNDIKSEPVNPNKSRAEAITNLGGTATILQAKKQNDGKELTAAEIDSIFKAAPENMSDEGLLALAQRMFPGRKYNTLKNRIKQLHMFMQPGSQSSLSSGINVASLDPSIGLGDMSSGDYLVNRQKMKDAEKAKTSEAKLRAKEQEYENSVKDLLTMLKYEARDVLFEADNIKFDASKIEFTQGGEGGTGGGNGPGGPGGPNGPGGLDSDATKVPELSAETRKAAEQLQQSGSLTTLPGQDPLANYSDEQLQGLGVTRKEVRGAKGGREYSYTAPPKPKEGEGTFSKGASFEETSPLLMNRLMKDFSLTKEQAAGVIGNLAHESAGLVAGKQEINPVGGGRGGLGWAQWTGPRRRDFEAYLERTGQSADDPEANYGFLKEELMGPEKGALNKLKSASTVEEATVAFEQGYERAGIKHYGPRTDYARKAAGLYDPKATGGMPSLTAGLQNMQPANAPAVAGAPPGVGPGNVAVKEAYGPKRPGRPEESIRNIASSAAEKAGMSAITFTSGVGDWISPERQQGGQKTTQHSTGKALDVDGFASDEERARFIEEAVSMGANGVGVYKGGSIHIDQGDIRSWDLAKKKIYQDAIARGMEKRKLLQAQAEQKKKEDAEKEKQAKVETQPKPQEETKPKVQIKEESGLEKAAAKFGVTPESKQRMISENKPDQAAVASPPAATPAKLDPTAVQASQKVSELSKKTTMNREAATTQGPVTQNIISNNRQEADTTGTGYPPKDAPMPGLTATMDKHLDMLWA